MSTDLTQLITEQIINGLVSGSMYALMAIGFSLVWGILGILNFSYGSLYTLGGYITYYLINFQGIKLYAALTLSTVLMFLIGVAEERLIIRPFSRLREDPTAYMTATIMATVGLSVVIEYSIFLTFGARVKSLPLFFPGTVAFGDYQVGTQMLFVLFVSVSIIVAAVMFFKYARLGLAMQSLAQEPLAASLMGVNINRICGLTFGISTALAGLAGSLLAPVQSLSPSVGWLPFTYAFIVVVVGGLGNMMGIIFTGFAIGLIKSIGTIWISPSWMLPVIFGAMFAIVVWRPQGLFGTRGG